MLQKRAVRTFFGTAKTSDCGERLKYTHWPQRFELSKIGVHERGFAKFAKFHAELKAVYTRSNTQVLIVSIVKQHLRTTVLSDISIRWPSVNFHQKLL